MIRKVSTLRCAEPVLYQLRRGEVEMGEVLAVVRPILERRARYFAKRWKKQTLLDEGDLTAMMEAALWRAVDTWDPRRCADLVHYVDVQVGRAAKRVLVRASGYPDKRRSAPAEQVYVEDAATTTGQGEEGFRNENSFERLLSYYGGLESETHEDELVRREHRRARAAEVLPTLNDYTRQIVEMVLDGYTIQGAADAIYADRRARIMYQLDSQEQARKAAHAGAVRVRRKVQGESQACA